MKLMRAEIAAIMLLALLFVAPTMRAESEGEGVSPPQAWGDPDWVKRQSPELYHPELIEGNPENRSPVARPWWAAGVNARTPGEQREPEIITELMLIEDEPQEPELVYLGRYWITGYDICWDCCGKVDGITASLVPATVGRTCASSWLPFGTVLYIDGVGTRIVEDRGNLEWNDLDVLCADHDACFALTGWHDVYQVQEAGT